MSLLVWLSLDGNMNNQGLLGALTQTTTPAYVNGKLGKSLSTGGCKMSASQTASVLNNKAVSICFWVYINANTGSEDARSMFFGNDSMDTNNNRKFSLFNYPTINDLHWSWQNDTSNTTFTSGVLSGVLPSYRWTHVAVTYENPNGTIYINGIKKQSFTGVSASSSFTYETQVLENSTNTYKNDFRIYDHCLSPKEVKEISKGIVCHYKLNDVYCTNSINKYSGDTAEGKPVSSSSEFTIKKIDNERGYNFKLDYTGTGNNAWFNFQYPVFSFTAGKTYDYSCKVRINSVSNITMYFRAARMNNDWVATQTQVVKNIGQWTEYHLQIKLEAKSERSGTTYDTKPCVEFYTSSLATANTKYTIDFDIKDIQVAETTGNNEIPFSDGKYACTTEYDTSGYRNDGTIKAPSLISCNTSSPRYDTCYKLNNGSDNSIATPDFSFETMNQGTVSIWINRHSTDSTWRTYVFFANGYNWTGNGYDFVIFGGTGGQSITLDCCSNTYSFTPTLNTWYLYTLTWNFDTKTAKYYINGELKNTITNDKIGTTYASKHGQHFIGNAFYDTSDYSVSDFRLYTTALSDSDVKELYNTPISLTNNGTLMTQGEFKES